MSSLPMNRRPPGLPPRYGSSPRTNSPVSQQYYKYSERSSPSPRENSQSRRSVRSSSSRDYSTTSSKQSRDTTSSSRDNASRRSTSNRGRSPGPSRINANTNGAVEYWNSSQHSDTVSWTNSDAFIPHHEELGRNAFPALLTVPPMLPPRTPTAKSGSRNLPRPPLSNKKAVSLSSIQVDLSPHATNRDRHRSHSPAGSRPRSQTNQAVSGPTREQSFRRNAERARSSSRNSRSHSNSRNGTRSRSNSIARSFRGSGTITEKIFGDKVSKEKSKAVGNQLPIAPESILPRTLLTSSVFHNPSSDLWIATINTNQKSEGGRHSAKHLRAFSYPTEREAKESALANSPPRMLPFDDYPYCFICQGRFAVFRRAHHCRNCGVCICSSCSTTWPAKMIPETFNIKNTKSVTICNSCNWLSKAFKQALTKGEMETVLALYSTGNINLRCPFKSSKGEAMFPVHCAVEGGNLDVIKWLVDIHFCPIRVTHIGKKKAGKVTTNPLQTSRGRSVMSIAMEDNKVHILRYLVVEKKMSIYETKDLNLALGMLDSVLKMPSEKNLTAQDFLQSFPLSSQPSTPAKANEDKLIKGNYGFPSTKLDHANSALCSRRSSSMEEDRAAFSDDDDDDEQTITTISDACILCYEKSIDCVITPCGHQICCLHCSESLKNCPLCNTPGSFIKIYKP